MTVTTPATAKRPPQKRPPLPPAGRELVAVLAELHKAQRKPTRASVSAAMGWHGPSPVDRLVEQRHVKYQWLRADPRLTVVHRPDPDALVELARQALVDKRQQVTDKALAARAVEVASSYDRRRRLAEQTHAWHLQVPAEAPRVVRLVARFHERWGDGPLWSELGDSMGWRHSYSAPEVARKVRRLTNEGWVTVTTAERSLAVGPLGQLYLSVAARRDGTR